MIASLFRWLGHLSLPTLHRLGGIAGIAALYLSSACANAMTTNMALALGRDPTKAELRCNAIETGCMVFELPYIWQRPLAKVLGHVIEVKGWEKFDACARKARP